ncbi:MAG: family 43 glycosylhydrolase, partial [Paludibacter sp.]
AHVWKDGKMYIYSTKDESQQYMCSSSYDVISSPDLKNWTWNKNIFASKGEDDQVSYTDKNLYGPDCAFKNGKYFLYYCHQNGGKDMGVATSDSSAGPFYNGQLLDGVNQMLPSVFTDTDGQSYLCYGFFSLHVVKLKPNMTEIEPKTLNSQVLNEKDHFFHEGGQLFKRNGLYYLVYTQISRRGMATTIGYSTSKKPMGPYKYGGVIIDNFGCDPQVWNNIGSVAQFNKNWYVFYHRSTHGSFSMRKLCIEPIKFNKDGSIPEVEMTTQGVAAPLNPLTQIDAASACYLTGKVRIERKADDNEALTHIENQNTAAYKYYNFTQSPTKITVKVTPQAGGQLQIYAGSLATTLLAHIEIPAGDGITTKEISINITSKVTGVLPIFLRFYGQENVNLFELNWMKME